VRMGHHSGLVYFALLLFFKVAALRGVETKGAFCGVAETWVMWVLWISVGCVVCQSEVRAMIRRYCSTYLHVRPTVQVFLG
jgi:hypothetical protein